MLNAREAKLLSFKSNMKIYREQVKHIRLLYPKILNDIEFEIMNACKKGVNFLYIQDLEDKLYNKYLLGYPDNVVNKIKKKILKQLLKLEYTVEPKELYRARFIEWN